MTPNNIVAKFYYSNEIRPAVREFLDKTDPTLIKDISKHSSAHVMVIMTDGTIYHFMLREVYDTWQYGMTYRLYGDETNTTYHSGHPYQDLQG